MPLEEKAALDMSQYLPEETGAEESDLEGLDFGNDFDENAPAPEESEPEAVVEEEEAEVEEETTEVEAEVEEEPEEEPEIQEEVAAEEPEQEAEAKAPMIPKRRLDDVLAKQRKAEQEAAELRKQLLEAQEKANAQPDVDIKALSKSRNEAILDGDLDKAAELDEQIYNARTTGGNSAEQLSIEEIEERVSMKLELKTTVDTVFGQYPQFDTNSDQFDEDLNNEALVFQQAYLNQGYSPAEAVRRAADAALRVVRPDLMQSSEPKKAPVVEKRKTNVKKNVEAANSQPPKLNQGESGGKSSSEMVDITKLTDEEFDALPEATRARLRGDLG